MRRFELHHVVVFNGRRVVGIISAMDIVETVARGEIQPSMALGAPKAEAHAPPADPRKPLERAWPRDVAI